MKFALFVLLALCSTIARSELYSISKFEGPPFSVKPASGVYELGGLDLDRVKDGVQIMAYGDFNNDKYTDIVSLADDSITLTVWLYNHETFAFSILATIKPDNKIVAVIPGDYDYDGKLDLLLVTQTSSGGSTQLLYYIQTSSKFVALSTQPAALTGTTQPFVFDVDGDRRLDVMYMQDGARKIHSLEGTKLVEKDFASFVSSKSGCKAYTDVSSYKFTTPHSNTYVDFNGDCGADLFITSQDTSGNTYFEIWLRTSDRKFCLVDVTKITTPISMVSIGDMNNDGRLDLVYATLPDDATEAMSLKIVYNTFPTDPANPCGQPNNVLKSPFVYENAKVVSFAKAFAASTRLYSPDPTNRPSRIRIGDINIDGFADLLMVVDATGSEGKYGSILLAISQSGEFNFDISTASTDDQAYYTILNEDVATKQTNVALSSIPAQYVSFFDFDEVGKLGLWIVAQGKTDAMTVPIGVFNFVSSENFILKTLGLNGYKKDGSDDITTSLGGVYYGASVECKVTDIDGNPKLAKGSQTPQSAYSPLDLPYIFIGLGRTNNYVENFVMGISTHYTEADIQQRLWSPIIPNSQLIVNPLVDKDWTLDVYVNPTSETILIVLTTLVILIILGAIIIYLHAKEKEEDNSGRDRMINVFG